MSLVLLIAQAFRIFGKRGKTWASWVGRAKRRPVNLWLYCGFTGSAGWFRRTGNETFLNWKSKNIFFKSSSKTVWRVIFSFFDITSPGSARGLWSLIIGDDVITGSGPEQKSSIDFDVLGFKKFTSELCWSDELIKPIKLQSNTKMITTHDNYVIITIYEIRKTNEISRKTGLRSGQACIC